MLSLFFFFADPACDQWLLDFLFPFQWYPTRLPTPTSDPRHQRGLSLRSLDIFSFPSASRIHVLFKRFNPVKTARV